MWNTQNCEQFKDIVQDLLEDEDVQSMKELPQHGKRSNCLNHSLAVAYLSFLVCRRFGLDYTAAARAGLLHDFALCDWSEKEHGIDRLWKHPHTALQNAEERYELSHVEKDIIVKHMWPLTRPLPKHRESFVVSLADKACALLEMSRLYHAKNVKRNLAPAA